MTSFTFPVSTTRTLTRVIPTDDGPVSIQYTVSIGTPVQLPDPDPNLAQLWHCSALFHNDEYGPGDPIPEDGASPGLPTDPIDGRGWSADDSLLMAQTMCGGILTNLMALEAEMGFAFASQFVEAALPNFGFPTMPSKWAEK